MAANCAAGEVSSGNGTTATVAIGAPPLVSLQAPVSHRAVALRIPVQASPRLWSVAPIRIAFRDMRSYRATSPVSVYLLASCLKIGRA